MNNDFLFVYGLLRKKANHEMGQILSDSSEFISEATFQGKLFQIDHYPGVIKSDNASDEVFGDLIRISNHELLTKLDEFEGIGCEYSVPYEYDRQLVEVSLPGGSKEQGWIYLYNWSLTSKKQIRSGDFLNELH